MKVSIVIPAYNEEKYIGKTLESIKRLQKEADWDLEVLVINGGSTDRTAEVAQSYGAKIFHEPHKNIGFARQHGLKHAHGEIVAYTDADTIVPHDWLIKHLHVLKKSGVCFSWGAFKVFNGKFPYYHYINYLQIPIQKVWYKILGISLAAGQNIAFWRDKALSIGGFDQQLKVAEDIDIAARMRKVGKVVYSPDIIVYSSGRRSKEGIGFFIRILIATIKYYSGRRDLSIFKDYR